MNNLQDQARGAYKRGEYKRAIELFDRAIGHAPSVQLMDNRAACYEKIDELSTALKDAKKAIQTHREDATGYLRAGRLLVKMEKRSVALEIYTHGLKCIKHVGQGYEQLRKVHKELMNELCPPKSVDPMTVLPRELAETILEHLSFRERMNACLVSKPWMQFIRSIPSLWRHLDLSLAKRKVRSTFISRAINVGRTKLKIATLSNLYDFDKTLAALVKHCPLEELILRECGLQSQDLVKALAPATNLKALKFQHGSQLNVSEYHPLVTKLSERLEHLECKLLGRLPPSAYTVRSGRLTILDLTFEKHVNINIRELLGDLGKRMPVLQTLKVKCEIYDVWNGTILDLQDCTRLRHLELDFLIIYARQLRLPPSLASLRLTSVRGFGCPDSSLPNLESFFIKIQSVELREIEAMLSHESSADQALRNLMPGHGGAQAVDSVVASKLRNLAIETARFCHEDSVSSLLAHPRLKDLETLSFSDTQMVTDTIAHAIAAAKLKNLRVLRLSHTDITGVGVKDLVSAYSLEQLVLDNCRFVSPDAIEWARSKGVNVKYRMTDQLAGGKKLCQW